MQDNRSNDTIASPRLDALRDSMKGLVDQGHDKVAALKGRVVDLGHRARSRGGTTLSRTQEAIKARPMAAVAIAFGVGYFLMRLVRR